MCVCVCVHVCMFGGDREGEGRGGKVCVHVGGEEEGRGGKAISCALCGSVLLSRDRFIVCLHHLSPVL